MYAGGCIHRQHAYVSLSMCRHVYIRIHRAYIYVHMYIVNIIY